MNSRKPLPAGALLESVNKSLDDLSPQSCRKFRCELVTPMYGGGVKAGEVDRDMPIRATAIRGQLRFWWRLLNRKNYADPRSLFEAERAIWGGLGDKETLAASKVRLWVENVQKVRIERCARYMLRENGRYGSTPQWEEWAESAAYALFPAQGQLGNGRQSIETEPAQLAREGMCWELRVDDDALTPGQKQEVFQSIRWWATFGGVGARTRRGLGAFAIKFDDGTAFQYVSPQEVKDAGLELQLKPAQGSASAAWYAAIAALRDFRQGEGLGRNPGATGNRPGRSRWPEAAAIRKITGKHRIKADGTSFVPDPASAEVFPRAAFGLPIIFHFQGENSDRQPDPGDTELAPLLNGSKMDRMASPLILRPYPAGNGRWCPAALLLPNTHVWTMALQLANSGKGKSLNAPRQIRDGWPQNPATKRKLLASSTPMQPYGEDALTAFMAYFASPLNGARQNSKGESREATEERWEKAQITYNRQNGAVTARNGDGKTAIAIGEVGKTLWDRLSLTARQKIGNGFFRAAAIVKGTELLSLEETP